MSIVMLYEKRDIKLCIEHYSNFYTLTYKEIRNLNVINLSIVVIETVG